LAPGRGEGLKALLIAGGLGTRLRPLTYTRPKHLLPIANHPHIDHVIDLLADHGIQEVVLLTSYLSDAFSSTIAGWEKCGVTIEVAHETEPLGTAGAIKNAQHLLGDEAFFAINGDVLSVTNLRDVLAFHKSHGGAGTIVLTPVEDPSAFGVAETDGMGRIERFIEKPAPGTTDSNLINAGIYVLEPAVLDFIPSGQVVSLEREVFPQLAERGEMFATASNAYWIDIGTPEKYLQANMDALLGRFPTQAVHASGPGAVCISSSAQIAAGAKVSSACVGAACTIEDGAEVTEAVLLDGVRVGAGAKITRSTLGEGVEVKAGVHVTGLAVGDGEMVDRSDE
jgi:mannose-1-phosphate guanylyltransferase